MLHEIRDGVHELQPCNGYKYEILVTPIKRDYLMGAEGLAFSILNFNVSGIFAKTQVPLSVYYIAEKLKINSFHASGLAPFIGEQLGRKIIHLII